MAKELTLFDAGPAQPKELTDLQHQALEHVRQAGHDGIRPAELGAAMGSGPMYARSNGTQLLHALKKKGWVEQRRMGGQMVFVAIDAPTGDDFGEFPKGF